MEKLTELSNKFRNQQMKGRVLDKACQTGGGGQKNAQTQCTSQTTKVEMAVQMDAPKKIDRATTTVGLGGGPSELCIKVFKLEVLGKKKKKKKKPKTDKQQIGPDGSIPEEEESYYEYYEEEVDEDEADQGNTEQPQLAGVAGYQPVYVNNQKK